MCVCVCVCVYMYIYKYIYTPPIYISKFGDRSRGWPEGSLFNRYYCYIARYTDMWNKHRESEIHDIHEIGSGTKHFITFELKVIRHEERETQSFNPTNVRRP